MNKPNKPNTTINTNEKIPKNKEYITEKPKPKIKKTRKRKTKTQKKTIKTIIKETKIKINAFMQKTITAIIITIMTVIVPSTIITLALNLIGYPFNIQTLISSAALYFIIQEAKSFIKEMIKK